jgi:hypothetical protein
MPQPCREAEVPGLDLFQLPLASSELDAMQFYFFGHGSKFCSRGMDGIRFIHFSAIPSM